MALLGSPRAYLGLDIGTTCIKLVELLNRGHCYELSTYADAAVSPPVNLPNLVARMLDEAQASADALVMSLPNKAVFCAKLALPDIPESELAAAVKFKASEIVPAPLDDVELTWHRQPGGVYLVAAAKEAVESCHRLADQLKLKLIGTEAEIFSLMRTLVFSHKQNVLFCNIGSQEITLHIISHGFPHLSRTIGFGADNLKEDDATSWAPFLQAVKRAAESQPVSKTILVGGGAKLNQVKNRLAGLLGHEPTISNPWHSLAYQKGLEESLIRLGPVFAVAVGLARRQLPAL